MKLGPDIARLDLHRLQTVGLRDALGAWISCQRGSVWITQQGDDRDVVLVSGDSFRIDRPGMTIIEALEPAHIEIDARPCLQQAA